VSGSGRTGYSLKTRLYFIIAFLGLLPIAGAAPRVGVDRWLRTRRGAAYDEARTLYKQVGSRLGEANVLRGLGELERGLGRNEQARTAYDEAAQLFGSLGMTNHRDEALHGASLASTR
jgi:hypothetical protein